MPSSYYEHLFYSLCLKVGIPVVAIRQDSKQDIRQEKIKNIDFILHTSKHIYLIDVKGSSSLSGDTKVKGADIKAMKSLSKLYGEKCIPLFVFVWVSSAELNDGVLSQKFKIKAVRADKFKATLQKWEDTYRCSRTQLQDIWEFFPQFRKLISVK